jgi:hypothetical protein
MSTAVKPYGTLAAGIFAARSTNPMHEKITPSIRQDYDRLAGGVRKTNLRFPGRISSLTP